MRLEHTTKPFAFFRGVDAGSRNSLEALRSTAHTILIGTKSNGGLRPQSWSYAKSYKTHTIGLAHLFQPHPVHMS